MTSVVVMRLTRGVVPQASDVCVQEPPVKLHPGLLLRHVEEVAQVPHEDPLEDAGVQVTGPVGVTRLHQHSFFGHLTRSKEN